MKKIMFLFFLIIFASADSSDKCGVFTNVLQTRNPGSEIEMQSSGERGFIENNNNCFLNTSNVYRDSYGHGLVCDTNGNGQLDSDETLAKETERYGNDLNITYTKPFESADIDSSPSYNSYLNKQITKDEILKMSDYNKIETDWNGPYNVTFNFNGDKRINKITNIKSNFIFENNDDVEIGTIETKGTKKFARFIFNDTPKTIKIKEITASSQIEANFTATDEIDIGEATLYGNDTNVTFSAPKVVINNKLTFGSGGNGNSQVTIKADVIYIDEIMFENTSGYQLLKIEPYTPGKRVLFVLKDDKQITTGSNSHILVDSGDYYIGKFDLAASKGYTILKASDENQDVNLYINSDLEIPSAVGFNTNGVGDNNFGNNPTTNFKIYINGDLETVSRTAFNALIYLEGETNLGSATYIKGAISSGDTITIGNDSKFYWDDTISSLPEAQECVPPVASYDNNYVCGIFKAPLTTYDTVQGNGKAQICGTKYIYAKVINNDIYNNSKCSINTDCSILNSCLKQNPPVNKYTPKFVDSAKITDIPDDLNFTDRDYKNNTFTQNNIELNFDPQTSYSDNSTKYSTFGDWTFEGDNITLNFKPGDYYFDELTFNGDNININVLDNGPVRIFVKENVKFDKNSIHINDKGDENNLFIYVGGNLEFPSTGEENGPQVKAFVYVKGNVEFKSNSNDFYWYGGITAEGDITIDSNNAHFIYRGINNKLGYENCPLCYALNNNGHWVNFFNFMNMQFNFPRDIGIVNSSGDTLNDVNVSQIEDTSGFSGTGACYRVVDENGNDTNKPINIDYSGNGKVMNNCVVGGLGDTNTTAEIGTYPSGGFTNYYMIETKGISDQFMGSEDLLFYANYLDNKGRKYQVQLDYCEISQGSYTGIRGPFDAWDVWRNIHDRNISTKIVNKEFNLTLASLNNEDNALERKNKGIIDVAIFDMNTSNQISNTVHFDTNKSAEIEGNFTVIKASKNARVGFKLCSDYNSTTKTHILYEYSKCDTNIVNCNVNGLHLRRCYSTDNFAIRPDHFEIAAIPVKLKAGESFDFNVSANAKDYNTSVNVDVNLTKNCSVKRADFNISSITFKNGDSNNTVKFGDVGVVDINLTDKNWASVDDKDTPQTCDENGTYICLDKSVVVSIVPHHFAINASYKNFKDSNFTYISRDLNMSSVLDINIAAQNKQNQITKNYNAQCYAKDVEINISKELNAPNLNLIYIYKDVSDNNSSVITQSINSDIQINYTEGNFTTDNNGSTTITLFVNFDKNYTTPVNSFDMNITDINVSDGNVTDKVLTFTDNNASFRYGRIEVKSVSGYGKDLNTTFKYLYWDNAKGWIVNEEHNVSSDDGTINLGNIKGFYTSNGDINMQLGDVIEGNEDVNISTTHSLPYSAKIHLSIPSWLWYHPLAKNYEDPSSSNPDCLTHPCLKAEFVNNSKGWGGVSGISHQDFNATKRTSKIEESNTTTKSSKKGVSKLNW